MIGESTQAMSRRLEADFNFESEGIESDDINGTEGQIGSHEDDVSGEGVGNEDKADDALSRSPEQIESAVRNLLVVLTIDRTRDGGEEGKVPEDGAKTDLFSIELGPAALVLE